jgi:DNA polymerase I
VFLIADGNNLAWAGFHALRRFMAAETPEEKTRCALLGLTQSAIGAVVRGGEPPEAGAPGAIAKKYAGRVTRFAVAFDEGRPLRRRTVWPAYQTGRESDPSFAENERFILGAIEGFVAMARMLPMEVFRGVNTEADDLIAYAVLNSEGAARIASTDRDFMQLLDERVSIYSPVKRIVITAENFAEQASPRGTDKQPIYFPRERYLDYRVASGDSSDDLPGIPGLGTIGAARLLAAAPLDAYLAEPALATRALGRSNVRLLAALRNEAPEIVARNRVLMDLRAAAARYDTIEDMTVTGTWNEAGFRAWVTDQRIAGMETEAAVRAMDAVANGPRAVPPAAVQGSLL